MSEQKIYEFRERAQVAVAAPEPDLLLQRGRALRRRRQLVPVAALAVCAVIGVALLAPGSGGPRTDQSPAGQPTVTESPDPGPTFLGDIDGPGTYAMDVLGDDRPDATVELVGDGWNTWSGGAVIQSGQVSWGFQPYRDTPIDQCHPSRHASSRSGAVRQLTQIPGSVTRPARPAVRMGMPGTYLQLSIPYEVDCPTGKPYGANLMAIWPGPPDPTVTLDVWLLEDGDHLLILTRGMRGNPSPDTVKSLNLSLDSLRYAPTS